MASNVPALPSGVQPLSLNCDTKPDSCGRARIYRIEPMAMRPSPFLYCPFCGGPASAIIDLDADVFETWSTALDIEVEILRLMYEVWDSRTYTNFFDFARKAYANPEVLAV